jgi:ADP-ribose pyrophosphatase YjhB (NUDIX family)
MKIDSSWYTRPLKIPSSTSAGGVIVRIENGKPLVALVKEEPYGVYILPKGRLEKGEDLEKAARREIEEEAGLSKLSQVQYLGARARLSFDKRKWITIHYFLFLTRQKKGKPTDQEHVYACEWFPLEALPEMLWPDQRELLESCREKIRSLADRVRPDKKND